MDDFSIFVDNQSNSFIHMNDELTTEGSDKYTGRPTNLQFERKFFNKKIDCLDKGFVRLVDYMGTDASIVQAARVSYGDGTKTVREDKKLIDYLWKNEHLSPFEMVSLKFHCKMPIFVARQWVRHRTAKINEISGRYSILSEEFYVPDKNNINSQCKDNKQGRGEILSEVDASNFLHHLNNSYEQNKIAYELALEDNVARELARISLPVSTYTEWYWKIDLRNLLHFLKLRLDSHAQYEIRVYAEAMATIVKALVPYTWESFEEHTLYGTHLSRSQSNLIKKLMYSEELTQEEKDKLKMIFK